MGSLTSTKPHAVLIPYPAQGHINPFMQLAKLLLAKNFHITFINNDHNHLRLLKSKGHEFHGFDDLRFESVPDGLPPSDRDATQDVPKLTESIYAKSVNQPLSDLIKRLNLGSDVPPVSCVISDVVMFFAWEVADELGIPNFQFWTASACGLLGYLQYEEFIQRGIVPFKDENFLTDGSLDLAIDCIPGMPYMRLKDFPSFMRITKPDDLMFNYLRESCNKCLKSSAMLLNTFDDFEHDVLEEIKKLQPNIYTGGPLNMLLRHTQTTSEIASFTSSLWREEVHCLEWLDKQSPESVIYVNYGSVTIISDHHLNEFAWGLANSKHPFLWIVRPDVVMNGSVTLPSDFYNEIKNRGLITSWCPQPEVLKHPSIGVYLTHCGWNSITESVTGGVPLMCWPFFAEQQTNSRFACKVWDIGVEVNGDVKREELAEQVREMLEGKSGEVLRKNAKEWRRKAEAATDIGGSAYVDFHRFVAKVVRSSGLSN